MSIINLELPETVPTMTTRPEETFDVMTNQEVVSEVSETLQKLERLSPAERQQVEAFAKQINLHDNTIVTCYGANAQRKLETFTDRALDGITGRSIGEVGNLLAELSVNIKTFDKESTSKWRGMLQSTENRIKTLQVRYESVSKTLERVKKDLVGRYKKLEVDVKELDVMYQENLDYFKELTMYILAGKQKLEETRNGELLELQRRAATSNAEEDALAYNDFKNQCEDFEKQLYDLELTRAVCLQTAPQIRLVQQTDKQLMRKIQSSINNTIPIWKQKITVALAVKDAEDAANMQREMTDLTSRMLEETSKKLHTTTVAVAREAERGIINVEAIKNSNTELLATIDEILTIQEEGRRNRAAAEVELRQAEEDLKQKLIGASQRARNR